MKAATVLGLSLAALELGMLCFCCYGDWHYVQHKSHKSIEARNAHLSRPMLFSLSLSILVSAAWLISYSVILDQDSTPTSLRQWTYVLNDWLRLILLSLYLCRASSLFWNMQYMYASVDKIWRDHMMGARNNRDAECDDSGSKETLKKAANAQVRRANMIPMPSHSYSLTKQASTIHGALSDNVYLRYNHLFTHSMRQRILMLWLLLLVPLIVFITDGIPLMLGYKIDSILFKVLHFGMYSTFLAVALVLVNKASEVDDRHMIGDEIKYVNWSLVLIWSLFFVCDVVVAFSTDNSQVYKNIYSVYLDSLGLCVSSAVGHYFATIWVVTQVKLQKLNSKVIMEQLEEVGEKDLLDLNQVLSIRKGFEQFAHFLVAELAVENLLFLVEVKQFKGLVRKQHTALVNHVMDRKSADAREKYHSSQSVTPKSHGAKQQCESMTIKVTPMSPEITEDDLDNEEEEEQEDGDQGEDEEVDKVPQRNGLVLFKELKSTTTTRASPTIFQSSHVLEVEWIPKDERLISEDVAFLNAKHIFSKFIVTNAPLQINIPGRMKKKIVKYFDQHSVESVAADAQGLNQLFELYDQAWVEIWKLVERDSFFRFKSTQMYLDLYKNHSEEIGSVMRNRSESGIHKPVFGDFIRGVEKIEEKIVNPLTRLAHSLHDVKAVQPHSPPPAINEDEEMD